MHFYIYMHHYIILYIYICVCVGTYVLSGCNNGNIALWDTTAGSDKPPKKVWSYTERHGTIGTASAIKLLYFVSSQQCCHETRLVFYCECRDGIKYTYEISLTTTGTAVLYYPCRPSACCKGENSASKIAEDLVKVKKDRGDFQKLVTGCGIIFPKYCAGIAARYPANDADKPANMLAISCNDSVVYLLPPNVVQTLTDKLTKVIKEQECRKLIESLNDLPFADVAQFLVTVCIFLREENKELCEMLSKSTEPLAAVYYHCTEIFEIVAEYHEPELAVFFLGLLSKFIMKLNTLDTTWHYTEQFIENSRSLCQVFTSKRGRGNLSFAQDFPVETLNFFQNITFDKGNIMVKIPRCFYNRKQSWFNWFSFPDTETLKDVIPCGSYSYTRKPLDYCNNPKDCAYHCEETVKAVVAHAVLPFVFINDKDPRDKVNLFLCCIDNPQVLVNYSSRLLEEIYGASKSMGRAGAEFFETPIMALIVKHKWKKYGFRLFQIQFCVYLFELVLFVAWSLLRSYNALLAPISEIEFMYRMPGICLGAVGGLGVGFIGVALLLVEWTCQKPNLNTYYSRFKGNKWWVAIGAVLGALTGVAVGAASTIILEYIIIAIILFLLVVRTWYEWRQYRRMANYIFDLWNIIDFLLITVGFASIGTFWSGNSAFDVVLACNVYLKWLGIMYFFRGFKATGALIRMIKEIVQDVKWLILVLAICVFALANFFFVLLNSNRVCPENSNNTACKKFLDLGDPMKNPGEALFATFNMLILSTYDIDLIAPGPFYWVLQVVFAFSMLFVPIILLNLLIAVMSSSYKRINARSEMEVIQLRAYIILELECFLRPYQRENMGEKDMEEEKAWNTNFPRYMHVLSKKKKKPNQ